MGRRVVTYSIVPFGALLLMLFALYGNYPLVSNDTGTYIDSAFTLMAPADRTITYGLFIRLTSLGLSLWLTVFFQCLLLSWLLINFLKGRIPGIAKSHIAFLLAIVSLGTICGWYASQLMPDIFTSILCLTLLNFLFNDNSKQERVAYIVIIFLAALMHNSHLIILTIFSLITLLLLLRKAKYVNRSKFLAITSVSVLSWFSVSLLNYVQHKAFTPSRSTHVFLMGKLVESGVLKTYLDKACPIKPYKICAFKDSLPPVAWEFVWDAPSPLQRTGGWDANRKEYNIIIKDIATRPKYIAFIGYKSLEATLRQLVLINTDGSYDLPWVKFLEDTPPYENIKKYFPHELSEFRNSALNNKTFNLALHNAIFGLVFLLSSLLVLFTWRYNNARSDFAAIYLVAILFIICNAFTVATFANVLTRLNSRLIWILPMLNIVFLYRLVIERLGSRSQTNNP